MFWKAYASEYSILTLQKVVGVITGNQRKGTQLLEMDLLSSYTGWCRRVHQKLVSTILQRLSAKILYLKTKRMITIHVKCHIFNMTGKSVRFVKRNKIQNTVKKEALECNVHTVWIDTYWYVPQGYSHILVISLSNLHVGDFFFAIIIRRFILPDNFIVLLPRLFPNF